MSQLDDGNYFYDPIRKAFVCHHCNLKLESYCAPDEPSCQCNDVYVMWEGDIKPNLGKIAHFVGLLVIVFFSVYYLVGCVTVEQPKPLTKEQIYDVVRDIGKGVP